MGSDRILALSLAFGLVWPGTALALPSGYAREHPKECAEARAKNTDWRFTCADRPWCAVHKNDDRKSRIACDPYISEANPRLPSITVTRGWLDASRDLTEAEVRTECEPPDTSKKDKVCALSDMRHSADVMDGRLLPKEMKTARLGLRADIAVYVFPVTVVRLGIAAGGVGWIETTWNLNGNGPRETHSARLNPAEIDQLLAALNRSDFWRLPHQGRHMGVTDGEVAALEVSVPGWKDEAMDTIGDSDAVDLSVLANAISAIIRAHWRNVPGG